MDNGLTQIFARIKEVTESVRRQALAVIETEAVKSVQKNFEVGGRPAWAPSTKRGKAKGTKTLVVSGDLSEVSAVADFAASTVTLITSPKARAYARIQNEGGTINMPARTVRTRTVTAGKNKGRSVFAKNSHKRGVKETQSKPYRIVIPARPYMVIPPEDITKIINTIKSNIKL
jgi:phage gpG-like protein